MIWIPIIELDMILGFGFITVFGLILIRNQQINQTVVQFACVYWPLTPLIYHVIEIFDGISVASTIETASFDILLSLIIIIVIRRFKNFESLLLLILAYVAQYIIIHSVDLMYFYISLEAQNFCFLVICGLQSTKQSSSFTVESSLKYLLLSAISSGILLFAIAGIYLQTGHIGLESVNTLMSSTPAHIVPEWDFLWSAGSAGSINQIIVMLLLAAILFKIGAAPLHLWIVNIYSSVSKPLLIYISTAPKLALFHFWASSWQLIWIDNTLGVFVLYSLILGSLGAYGYGGNPSIRSIFAYSTISEIGLILLAIETAGFHSLFQHLSIYILTQVLVWNLSEKRLFSVAAISLAGLPPLAGFYGKAWIIWHSASIHIVTYVIVALISSLIAIVYNIRLIRLIWFKSTYQELMIIKDTCNLVLPNSLPSLPKESPSFGFKQAASGKGSYIGVRKERPSKSPNVWSEEKIKVTSFCVISLIFLPLFLIKPFVL